MDADLETCPSCGEDKPAGMRVCHHCLSCEAPPEAFIPENEQSDLDAGMATAPY
jgi:NMD protein affecting ribosome stability and mRNA decay